MEDVTGRGDAPAPAGPARPRLVAIGSADHDRHDSVPENWRRLFDAATLEQSADVWLALLAGQITRLVQGVVAGIGPDGTASTLAAWPKGAALDALGDGLVARAAAQNKLLIQRIASTPGAVLAAAPVSIGGRVRAVAAITFVSGGDDEPLATLRRIQWSLAWIELSLRRSDGSPAKDGGRDGDLALVLDLAADINQAASAREAALALVTELGRRLDCDRVTLGFRRGLTTRPYVLSHSATFGRRTQLMRAIAQAMDEAIDQGLDIACPPASLPGPAVRRLHEALIRNQGSAHVLTATFGAGALTFERSTDRPFTPDEVNRCRSVARILGPTLRSRHDAERPYHQIGLTRFSRALGALIGPHYLPAKLVAFALAAGITATLLVPIEYRVTANAVLEGSVRRIVSAPFEGYIGEAFAKSGDVVRQDDVLAKIDDRDLQIERQKWAVEATKHRQKFVESLSENQRAEAQIARAKLDQANAQLALLDNMIARTRIAAPFDGTVVTGDLSQSLGSAVSRGQALFEMAPLGNYRAKLKVDERDIAFIAVGQTGELTLAPFPTQTFPIKVERITLVSTPEDGINYFAIEASLPDHGLEALRPGMAGIGKIAVGRHSIFWIYSHRLIDTIRLWIWSL